MDPQSSIVSVAAFFRDNRMHGSGAKLGQAAAAAVVQDFFARYSYNSCSPDQLLALADLAVRARALDIAREALTMASRIRSHTHLAFYKLGRLELAADAPAEAIQYFTWGIEADPQFAFNYMARARASFKLGRLSDAIEDAERFAEFGERPHAPEDVTLMTKLADRLFESGERKRSRPLYALLRHVATESRHAVRLAEAYIADEKTEEALAVLRPLHASGTLDLWGRRALAQAETMAGRYQEAVRIAAAVAAERPADEGFVTTYLEALVRSKDPSLWRAAISLLGTAAPPDCVAELRIRLAIVEQDLAAALAELELATLRPHHRLFFVAVETAYAALADANCAVASTITDLLEAAAPDNETALILRTDVFLRMQSWEQAGETLRRLPDERANEPGILLKWFEYYCFTGNTGQARQVQATLEANGLPSRQFVLPILRFLAERQDWAELTDRALAWLGADFQYPQIGYVLFRAARRTGRHGDFISAIEAIDGWQTVADLRRLHTALAWDQASTLVEMDQVAASAASTLSPALRHRMEVQRTLFARAHSYAGRRAVFLCTNSAYFCATVVALYSAMQHSAPGREKYFVVVDDALTDYAGAVMQPFRALGFDVAVVPAGDIVANAERLSADYGLFTSGHRLASAAYYRIYFARYLRMLGGFDRAIYIDSDVLVRKPLDMMFAQVLGERAISARIETPRPEVSRAIALHKLEGNLYFNSGVLLFDLTNPLLDAGLDDAVGAIQDENVTLLFHDQCALNLGFRNRFKPLDMAWNVPIGEAMPISKIPQDAAILHYLDRPKPWSAAYGGECGTLWFEQWRQTAALLGEAEAVRLFWMTEE